MSGSIAVQQQTVRSADAQLDPFATLGAGAVLAYSFVVTLIIGKIIDATIGFRISGDQEVAGIDLAVHAERAYELSDNSQGSVLAHSKGA